MVRDMAPIADLEKVVPAKVALVVAPAVLVRVGLVRAAPVVVVLVVQQKAVLEVDKFLRNPRTFD